MTMKSSMMMILMVTSFLFGIVTARSSVSPLIPLPPSFTHTPPPPTYSPTPSPAHTPIEHPPTPSPIEHSSTPSPISTPSGLVISPSQSPSVSDVPAAAPISPSQSDAVISKVSIGLVAVSALAVAALVA